MNSNAENAVTAYAARLRRLVINDTSIYGRQSFDVTLHDLMEQFGDVESWNWTNHVFALAMSTVSDAAVLDLHRNDLDEHRPRVTALAVYEFLRVNGAGDSDWPEVERHALGLLATYVAYSRELRLAYAAWGDREPLVLTVDLDRVKREADPVELKKLLNEALILNAAAAKEKAARGGLN